MSEDAISFSGVDEIGHEVKKNDQGPRGQARCQGCTQAQPSAETGAIGCETTTVQQNPWSLAISTTNPTKEGVVGITAEIGLTYKTCGEKARKKREDTEL